MSDNASTNTTVTILPNNIKTKIKGALDFNISTTLSAASGDGWFYAEKDLSGVSGQLIESTEDYLGSATDAGTVASGDKVRWIVVKHTGTSDGSRKTSLGIVLTMDGNAAAYNSTGGIFLEPGEMIALKPSFLEASNFNGIVVNSLEGIPSAAAASTNKARVIIAGIVTNIA